jgi:hypothetical protein
MANLIRSFERAGLIGKLPYSEMPELAYGTRQPPQISRALFGRANWQKCMAAKSSQGLNPFE